MRTLITIALLCIGTSSLANGWLQKANFGGDARHRGASFSIGNIGYVGLGHINAITNDLFEDFWAYNPASNSWTQIADFGGGLRYHSVGFSMNGKGYCGTGRTPTGAYSPDLWEYDPTTNVWTMLSNFPGQVRRGAVSFVIDTLAFIGTGQIGPGTYTNDFFAYAPASDTWYGIPSLPAIGRTSSVGFALNGKGYVGTGDIGGGTIDFWEFDLATVSWTQKANVGNIIRQEATGFGLNGLGYIGTGDNFSSGTSYNDFWEYDPIADTWTQIENFPGLKRRYMESVVIGNKAYMGIGTNGINFKDWWEFDQVLSVVSRKKELVKVTAYPNPAVDYVNFELSQLPQGLTSDQVQVSLYDLMGRKVETQGFTNDILTINTNDLTQGIYVYHIEYSGQVIRNGKIMITR